MIKLRIDVDYPYPSRAKFPLHSPDHKDKQGLFEKRKNHREND